MNRSDALGHLKPRIDRIYEFAGRSTEDSDAGYGPAIDDAYRGLDLDPALYLANPTLQVTQEDRDGFRWLLMANAYQIVLNDLAIMVDSQHDAPLTLMKLSQITTHVRKCEAIAWDRAAMLGHSPAPSIRHRFNLDFIERDEEEPRAEV